MNNRIVIVGFMGCGKTTVARGLAARLSCEMIDLDSFITEREGRSPAEIIQKDGEPAFREIETRALSDVVNQTNAKVIALGGGAWTIEANRKLVEQHDCLIAWIDTPFDVCWQRIQSSAGTRPLAPDRETARKLYESRQDDFRLSSIHIRVAESDTPETIADRILTET